MSENCVFQFWYGSFGLFGPNVGSVWQWEGRGGRERTGPGKSQLWPDATGGNMPAPAAHWLAGL